MRDRESRDLKAAARLARDEELPAEPEDQPTPEELAELERAEPPERRAPRSRPARLRKPSAPER